MKTVHITYICHVKWMLV